HYSVVARAPVGARTADATFTAGQVSATPTAGVTPTSSPAPTATATVGAGPTVTVSPAVAQSGGSVTVSWQGNPDPLGNFHLATGDLVTWYTDPAFYGDCTQEPPSTVIASGSCTVTLPALGD